MDGYYTVSQYAKLYGKDPGNIRKMLIKGSLKGEKIGSQWIIPKDVDYPKDRRVINGDYRNWRRRVKLKEKHPELIRKLCEVCNEIYRIYSDSLDRIVLYGSYARGQETQESDIDIALLLKKEQTDEQYDRLTDTILDYELDLGVTFSVIQIDQNEYKEWNMTLPFYKNIDKEGIILWKKD